MYVCTSLLRRGVRETRDHYRHIVARATLVESFVHNSVARVLQVATRLAQLLPEATVANPSSEEWKEG